jgi:hypothetical protein
VAQERPGSSTLILLEDAVHLVRRLPFSTWVLHWTGGVPFALAILLFCRDITEYQASSAACFWDAVLLGLTLAWMNCWRAVYAARLREQLSGETPTRVRIWQLAASQTFLGAAKLILLPLSALVLFPLAPMTAFFRYSSALAARPDLDAFQVTSRASKLSRIRPRTTWVTLAALVFVQLIVFANVAIALIALPQVAKMLTGVETDFSRGGTDFVKSPLFVMCAWMLAWLLADPYVQAVYSTVCFRRESMETGEDLRVSLRRLRQKAAATIAAAALLFALPLRAANEITQSELRQAIAEARKAHEYDWRFPPGAPQAVQQSWLLNAAETVTHWLGRVLHAIGNGIDRLVKWIFDRMSGLTPSGSGAAAPAAALHWWIYLVLAAIIALIGYLAWRLYRTRGKRLKATPQAVTLVRLEDESVTPDRLPEEEWLEMAEARLREGDLRHALRAFYLANLAYLGRANWIAVHPGKTNREYARDLQRRARQFAEPQALFAQNLAVFERAWYGLHAVELADVDEFRERARRMKALLTPRETPMEEAA